MPADVIELRSGSHGGAHRAPAPAGRCRLARVIGGAAEPTGNPEPSGSPEPLPGPWPQPAAPGADGPDGSPPDAA
jgi:hypothetical protein